MAERRATKAVVMRRVAEVLRIRLDGAELWDIRDYIRLKQAEKGSAWHLADAEKPLGDSMLWKYVAMADEEIKLSFARKFGAIRRNHVCKRRNLYAKSVAAGDYAGALRCLDSEAKLLGLFPSAKLEVEQKAVEAPAGHMLTLEWLGQILAPYGEAKQAVGEALAAVIDARKAQMIGDKK